MTNEGIDSMMNVRDAVIGTDKFIQRNSRDLPQDPNLYKRLQEIGWEFTNMGAEGPYMIKGVHGLQLVQQWPDCPSIINKNEGIEGMQNLHIYELKDWKTIHYGYCNNIEEFNIIWDWLSTTGVI